MTQLGRIGIVTLLLVGGAIASAQVESRSAFATAGADVSSGPYRVHTTIGNSTGGRHAGGFVYEAHAGWKASIHNTPLITGGEATLGPANNGSYTISYDQLLAATGARDPDGDVLGFIVTATAGELRQSGGVVGGVLLNEGESFDWVSGAGGLLNVVATDSMHNSSSMNLRAPAGPPSITQHPQNLRVEKGQPALLSAMVSGAGPLSYQWFKDGQTLNMATNLNLPISLTTRSSQGLYQLEVVGPGGTNRSREATLRVVSAQRISSIGFGFGGNVLVGFGDADGAAMSTAERQNFTIQTSTNLDSWVTVSTNGSSVSFSGGQLIYSHTPGPGSRKSFFRVLE